LTITVDGSVPIVTNGNTNDSDNKVKSSDALNISVTVNDGSISTVTVNGTTMLQAGTLWSTLNTSAEFCPSVSDGVCVLTFIATDSSENINNTETLTIIIDDSTPAVTGANTDDSNNNVRSDSSLNISLTVIDTNTVSSVIVNGTTMLQAGNSWSTLNTTSDFGCSSDGACVLTFIATDEIGNINNSETLTITVDDTIPTVTSGNTSDLDNVVVSTDSINISVTVSDTNITTVILNGTTMEQAGTLWSTLNTTSDFGCSSDGSCVLTFIATDLAGNINNTHTLTITVDDSAPSVNLTSPLENGSVKSIVDLEGTYLDAGIGLSNATYYYSMGGGMLQIGNTSTSAYNLTWNTTGMTEGYYNITVIVFDSLGNDANDTNTNITVDNTAPENLTFSLSDSTLSVGGSVSGSCSGDDVWDKSPTGVITSPGTSSAGSFTATCTVTDDAGNLNSTTLGYTVTATSTSSSSSGGSSGSREVLRGGNKGNTKNPSQSMSWIKVIPEKALLMKITNEELGIKEIMIKVNNEQKNVELQVEKLPEKPAEVTHNITGKVYQYLSIDKYNIENIDISSVEIDFKVSKSWLLENGINEENIVLNKFTDEWIRLFTTKLSSDNEFVYYRSYTKGFSNFAISEKLTDLEIVEKIVESEEIVESENQNIVIEDQQPEVAVVEDLIVDEQVQKKKSPWLLILALGTLIIGGVLGVFVMKNKKPIKKK
ncbi:PGF-pre-PGF domain-containing protein, partial [archaeon]|nr:PGF-pre-PGF domain-containing protein [archaeon]